MKFDFLLRGLHDVVSVILHFFLVGSKEEVVVPFCAGETKERGNIAKF